MDIRDFLLQLAMQTPQKAMPTVNRQPNSNDLIGLVAAMLAQDPTLYEDTTAIGNDSAMTGGAGWGSPMGAPEYNPWGATPTAMGTPPGIGAAGGYGGDQSTGQSFAPPRQPTLGRFPRIVQSAPNYANPGPMRPAGQLAGLNPLMQALANANQPTAGLFGNSQAPLPIGNRLLNARRTLGGIF